MITDVKNLGLSSHIDEALEKIKQLSLDQKKSLMNKFSIRLRVIKRVKGVAEILNALTAETVTE